MIGTAFAGESCHFLLARRKPGEVCQLRLWGLPRAHACGADLFALNKKVWRTDANSTQMGDADCDPQVPATEDTIQPLVPDDFTVEEESPEFKKKISAIMDTPTKPIHEIPT